jgi:EAL domain-containing protein (putative c-di-GMP-specific phosphodiesterase class I)
VSLEKHDEYHRLRTAYLRLRAALRDPNTELYHYTLALDEVRGMFVARTRVAVLWISLGERRVIETVYGWQIYDQLLGSVARWLDSEKGRLFPPSALIAHAGVHGDAFVVFVAGDRDGGEFDLETLQQLVRQLEPRLEAASQLDGTAGSLGQGRARIGAALLTDNPYRRFERSVQVSLDEARALAEQPREAERLAWIGELHRVMDERSVRTVYQPIVALDSGAEQGIEAYSRGPELSVFRLPRVMLSLSREAGMVYDLDRLCRASAVRSVAGRSTPSLLFINTAAENLIDPQWRSLEFQRSLDAAGLTPAQIVIEVAESALADRLDAYRQALEWLRESHYKFSLDDAGSSPQTSAIVASLRPDFIKFDLGLVRGLCDDPLARETVRSIVQLARRAGATLIIERIEHQTEREVLLQCGACWGQGYLFGAEQPTSEQTLDLRSSPGDA